jgi:hypothetical protein
MQDEAFMDDAGKPRRVPRVVALLVVLGTVVLVTGALVMAYKFGASAAVASAAGVLVYYKEPALEFDWRGAFDELADGIGKVLDRMAALFDW